MIDVGRPSRFAAAVSILGPHVLIFFFFFLHFRLSTNQESAQPVETANQCILCLTFFFLLRDLVTFFGPDRVNRQSR